MSKLMSLGIRSSKINDWFSSYLSAKEQCVVIDNISSEHKSISMEVPMIQQYFLQVPPLFLRWTR